MNARELFNLIQSCKNIPDSVMCVYGEACDNAGDTIIENGGKFERGVYTDEFIDLWLASVQTTLSFKHSYGLDANEWFAAHGVKW